MCLSMHLECMCGLWCVGGHNCDTFPIWKKPTWLKDSDLIIKGVPKEVRVKYAHGRNSMRLITPSCLNKNPHTLLLQIMGCYAHKIVLTPFECLRVNKTLKMGNTESLGHGPFSRFSMKLMMSIIKMENAFPNGSKF